MDVLAATHTKPRSPGEVIYDLMDNITGKVIAITGASSGIGEATAELLVRRGCKMVLGARRKDRLDALVQRLGADALAVVTDVRKRADVVALVRAATERFGKLDVLVSNAGVAPLSALDELRVDDWEEMIDVNLKGVLHGIAAALPVFRAQGFGHFVHTVSTAGLKIVSTQVVYAATKNAVRTISEGLRQEAGPQLRVTSVSPGFVRAGLADGMGDEHKAAITKRMLEIAIAPDAIARAIAFAIEQPPEVDVNEIVIRPTAQS